MKKLLLTAVIGIVMTSYSFAQVVITSFANQSATWSDYYGEWLYKEVSKVEITFLIQNNVIIARDRANSTYTTLAVKEQNNRYTSWSAIDEKGRGCVVFIGKIDGYDVLLIMYDDYLIRYYH